MKHLKLLFYSVVAFSIIYFLMFLYKQSEKIKVNTAVYEAYTQLKENIIEIENDTGINDMECEEFITSSYIYCTNWPSVFDGDYHKATRNKGASYFPRYYNYITQHSYLLVRDSKELSALTPSGFPNMFVQYKDCCTELWYTDEIKELCDDEKFRDQYRETIFTNENQFIIRLHNCSSEEFCLAIEKRSAQDGYTSGSTKEIRFVDLFKTASINWQEIQDWTLDGTEVSPSNKYMLLLLSLNTTETQKTFYFIYSLESEEYQINESTILPYSLSYPNLLWVTDEYFGFNEGDITMFRLKDFAHKKMPKIQVCSSGSQKDIIWDDENQKLLILCDGREIINGFQVQVNTNYYVADYPDFINQLLAKDGWQQNQQPE